MAAVTATGGFDARRFEPRVRSHAAQCLAVDDAVVCQQTNALYIAPACSRRAAAYAHARACAHARGAAGAASSKCPGNPARCRVCSVRENVSFLTLHSWRSVRACFADRQHRWRGDRGRTEPADGCRCHGCRRGTRGASEAQERAASRRAREAPGRDESFHNPRARPGRAFPVSCESLRATGSGGGARLCSEAFRKRSRLRRTYSRPRSTSE